MLLKVISGIILFFNVVGYLLIWMQMDKNVNVKIKDSIINKLIVLLSILGGFIGIYLAARMFGFAVGEKWFNIILKRVIGLELLIIIGVAIYYNLDFSQINYQSILQN